MTHKTAHATRGRLLQTTSHPPRMRCQPAPRRAIAQAGGSYKLATPPYDMGVRQNLCSAATPHTADQIDSSPHLPSPQVAPSLAANKHDCEGDRALWPHHASTNRGSRASTALSPLRNSHASRHPRLCHSPAPPSTSNRSPDPNSGRLSWPPKFGNEKLDGPRRTRAPFSRFDWLAFASAKSGAAGSRAVPPAFPRPHKGCSALEGRLHPHPIRPPRRSPQHGQQARTSRNATCLKLFTRTAGRSRREEPRSEF